MRNTTLLPLTNNENLIIANDNSGAIGEKDGDKISVPYEILSYYSFRVAVMECMAAGGDPFSIILHNFCGEESWKRLISGVERGLSELGMNQVTINGSTESNYTLDQSAIGIVVLGKSKHFRHHYTSIKELTIAVIGSPLMGHEVVEQPQNIAPLSLFKSFCSIVEVHVWPVGSKGIIHELNSMNPNLNVKEEEVATDLNLMKSAGPSTCFIIAFPSEIKEMVRKLASSFYHPLNINRNKYSFDKRD